MPGQTTLHIRQHPPVDGTYTITLTLRRPGRGDLTAEAQIKFALSEQEQEDIRWYMEDYLERAHAAEAGTVTQIEEVLTRRGEELFEKVLEGGTDDGNARDMRRMFDRVFDDLAGLRIEITTGVAEAASIPWELMREPASDSAIALRVKSFVRKQSNPSTDFIDVPGLDGGGVRLLYVACRPGGRSDVELRAVANRLLQDLGDDLPRFEIKALRPPTFEQLQSELQEAKNAGRPYHIVHFDGHGIYADLSESTLGEWLKALSALTLGAHQKGKHGYLLFEHPDSDENVRPVDGQTLGQLLRDTGVPILVLNACQSAMHEAVAAAEHASDDTPAAPKDAAAKPVNVHEEIRAIGSLAQVVVDNGIPAVLGMRYSVYVVTAAQYIGQLYKNLAKGSSFGQAASTGRKHLQLNPERWVGLEPRPLQDWSVPVVYEAAPIRLVDPTQEVPLDPERQTDPAQVNPALLRYVPDSGFVGRDETLLALDRAFDEYRVVLLHAYAGQGKTATAVEFARWYGQTGGLGRPPAVLVSRFENRIDLNDVLNQVGQRFAPLLAENGTEWASLNDIEQKRDYVLNLLRRIPVLWIWDNVEPVAGFPEGTPSAWTKPEQEELALFLRQLRHDNTSKVKLLLTSRREERGWLGDTPHRIEMPRMRNTDAANLALQLGHGKGVTREVVRAWQPLIDYCQGNPMTLRVLILQALKEGRRTREQIEAFVEAIRSGESQIQDEDRSQGRDRSLGASLDYGFKHAFTNDELPIVALLHLFQGTVTVAALRLMGQVGEHALPEVRGKTDEDMIRLLERAKDVGLLTQVEPAYFTIHPALPWFLRDLFVQHYDGQEGRCGELAAVRAWVEAVGELGDYYLHEYAEGNRGVIRMLELEEANLLHARRLARRHAWWARVVSTMQGLRVLYEHHGRWAEWARLVEEIVPEFCDAEDEPIPGREEHYSLVMDYRVDLTQGQQHDLALAEALQERRVGWNRRRAADVLALPDDAELDRTQRHRLHAFANSLGTLGQILMERGDAACVEQFMEAADHFHRINDTAREATAYHNLGHARTEVPAIRDLDAAEAAYQRSLNLRSPNDALERSKVINEIGIVYYERFRDARKRNEPVETLRSYARGAEAKCLEALRLCPNDAVGDLGPMHNQLGVLYREAGRIGAARKHYEQAVQCFERTGDRYSAGLTRYNMSLMYEDAARREDEAARRRTLFERARAYAEAALRDFASYEGRAAAEEADARKLIVIIDEAMENG